MSQNNGAFSPGGLNGLLGKSTNARDYYNSLPEYVQEMIQQRRQAIQSEDELKRYAENLLAGDK